jgi:NAD(P)-dependent dehydrogenase (short-subunit alcohol dehydrogenase family)
LIQRNKWPAVLPGYFNVNKQVALIIGASRGLGLALAKALAEVNGATPLLYRVHSGVTTN